MESWLRAAGILYQNVFHEIAFGNLFFLGCWLKKCHQRCTLISEVFFKYFPTTNQPLFDYSIS